MFRRPKLIVVLIAIAITALLLYPIATDHLHAASLLLCIQDPKTTSFIARLGTHSTAESPLAIGDIHSRIYTPLGVATRQG